MAGEKVYVIDRIITEPGCGKKFVDAYTTEYVPAAQRRGMTLASVRLSPAEWCTTTRPETVGVSLPE